MSKLTSYLNNNNDDYNKYVDFVCNKIKLKYNVEVYIVDDVLKNKGWTIYTKENVANKVYINKFISEDLLINASRISDQAILQIICAGNHEMRHCEQSRILIDINDGFGEKLAYSFIATTNNNFFYKDHYRELAFELDAEIDALNKTINFSRNLFKSSGLTDKQFEEAFVSFVNIRCDNPKYILSNFRNEKYTNLDEIQNDILKIYDEILYEVRDKNEHYNLYEPLIHGDEILEDELAFVLSDEKSSDLIEDINLSKNVSEMIEKVAVLMINMHPDWKQSYHSLDDKELSMVTYFGRDFTISEKCRIKEWQAKFGDRNVDKDITLIDNVEKSDDKEFD